MTDEFILGERLTSLNCQRDAYLKLQAVLYIIKNLKGNKSKEYQIV